VALGEARQIGGFVRRRPPARAAKPPTSRTDGFKGRVCHARQPTRQARSNHHVRSERLRMVE